MKKFLYKTLDVVLTIIMIASALYAIFNMVMSFLPSEIQSDVYGWLHMSEEYITTFSISSVINAAILVSAKVIQTYSKIKMTAQLAKSEEIITNNVVMNDAVLNKLNELINQVQVLQGLDDAILSVQKVTTERNIKASDKLVYKDEKEAYKQALEQIETAKNKLADVNNLHTVYEKTEVKEVIVEKEVNPNDLTGRV